MKPYFLIVKYPEKPPSIASSLSLENLEEDEIPEVLEVLEPGESYFKADAQEKKWRKIYEVMEC